MSVRFPSWQLRKSLLIYIFNFIAKMTTDSKFNFFYQIEFKFSQFILFMGDSTNLNFFKSFPDFWVSLMLDSRKFVQFFTKTVGYCKFVRKFLAHFSESLGIYMNLKWNLSFALIFCLYMFTPASVDICSSCEKFFKGSKMQYDIW